MKTLFIEPGSPWENGAIESFNGKLRDELLDVELFDTPWKSKVLCGRLSAGNFPVFAQNAQAQDVSIRQYW